MADDPIEDRMNTIAESPSLALVTRTCRTWLGEDGIVRTVLSRGSSHTLADAKDNVAAWIKVSGGTKRPALIDIRGVRSQDRDARAHYADGKNGMLSSAVALLIGSPLTRVLGNFYMGLNKTAFPTKMFTSETAALEWLRGFMP